MDEVALDLVREILEGRCHGVETYPFFALLFPGGRLTVLSAWRASTGDDLIGPSGATVPLETSRRA
jgi:hypothetical protein